MLAHIHAYSTVQYIKVTLFTVIYFQIAKQMLNFTRKLADKSANVYPLVIFRKLIMMLIYARVTRMIM